MSELLPATWKMTAPWLSLQPRELGVAGFLSGEDSGAEGPTVQDIGVFFLGLDSRVSGSGLVLEDYRSPGTAVASLTNRRAGVQERDRDRESEREREREREIETEREREKNKKATQNKQNVEKRAGEETKAWIEQNEQRRKRCLMWDAACAF